MQQPDYARETNYGIIIDVKNLDLQYDFYKILSIERTDINGNLRVFEIGVFPTSQNKVLYTTNIDKDKSSATIMSCHIRETPNITQSYS